MTRDLMYPIPQHVRDHIAFELHNIHDRNLRYKIRDMVRWSYASGYTDGHVTGVNETWADRQAEKDAEEAKEPTDAERRWGLLHEAIHGGFADCDQAGMDGSRCGTCLGCRIKNEVGDHD